MINEFVQVTRKDTNERVLLNLRHINYIKEIKTDSGNNYSLISIHKSFIQVHETFESFEEFFEENEG